MATFTRNAWATGDVITADGLNGGKGFPLLTISDDDYDQGLYFEVNTSEDFTEFDFFNMIVYYTLHTYSQDGEPDFKHYERCRSIEFEPEEGYYDCWHGYFGRELNLYYIPSLKKISSHSISYEEENSETVL